ncbi:Lethal(3)malignant brain tumor-like protein 4 [Myotis davidii]|uniref:Lethal(3)malignant brain tumor-like protein 4 n=1 Tax=Myotis davidii TaxID=225400 RepID=L5LYX1_MYODS|nr:Lethal(3)malignant brain tumor-like protein 4 [Myotis davidii]
MLNVGGAMTCTGHLKINGTVDLALTSQHSASPSGTQAPPPPRSDTPPNRSHCCQDPMAQNVAHSSAKPGKGCCGCRVHFDGWDHKYDYWMDVDSPDIHPIGWCDVTGHPLEVPYRANDMKILPSQAVCPTPGCRGIGHIRGPRYSGHHRHVQQAKCLKIKGKEDNDLDNLFRAHSVEHTQRPLHQSIFMTSLSTHPFRDLPLGREQHRKLLPGVADIRAGEVARWTVDQVTEFVQSLLGGEEHAKCFKKEQIDGKAFLLLTQTDIVKVMKIKLGPALKIYHSVLRCCLGPRSQGLNAPPELPPHCDLDLSAIKSAHTDLILMSHGHIHI